MDVKRLSSRVNDNPNIDNGVEDLYLGDELYQIVMEEFFRRLERRRIGIWRLRCLRVTLWVRWIKQ